jgi:elongation factor G
MEPKGNSRLITSHVPLGEMFGYTTVLRSITQGRGTSVMAFDHYSEVPENLLDSIIKAE